MRLYALAETFHEQNLKIPQAVEVFALFITLFGFEFLLGQLWTFRFGATPHPPSAPRANSTIDAEAKRGGGKDNFLSPSDSRAST